MTKEEILEKLREDEHYYGEFGKNFLSNSNISALLTNPLLMNAPHNISSYTGSVPRVNTWEDIYRIINQ
jgi:hypothetical protein